MSAVDKDLAKFFEKPMPLQWHQMQKETKIAIVSLSRRAGLSASQIATKLGTGRGAILGFAYREGLATSEPKLSGQVASAQTKTKVKRKRGAGDKHLEKRLQKQISSEPKDLPADEVGLRQALTSFDPLAKDIGSYVKPSECNEHQCKWPFDVDGKTMYCGRPVETGFYCGPHHNRAYVRSVK